MYYLHTYNVAINVVRDRDINCQISLENKSVSQAVGQTIKRGNKF